MSLDNKSLCAYRPNPNEELPAFAKALLPLKPPGNPPPKLELPALAKEFDPENPPPGKPP